MNDLISYPRPLTPHEELFVKRVYLESGFAASTALRPSDIPSPEAYYDSYQGLLTGRNKVDSRRQTPEPRAVAWPLEIMGVSDVAEETKNPDGSRNFQLTYTRPDGSTFNRELQVDKDASGQDRTVVFRKQATGVSDSQDMVDVRGDEYGEIPLSCYSHAPGQLESKRMVTCWFVRKQLRVLDPNRAYDEAETMKPYEEALAAQRTRIRTQQAVIANAQKELDDLPVGVRRKQELWEPTYRRGVEAEENIREVHQKMKPLTAGRDAAARLAFIEASRQAVVDAEKTAADAQ